MLSIFPTTSNKTYFSKVIELPGQNNYVWSYTTNSPRAATVQNRNDKTTDNHRIWIGSSIEKEKETSEPPHLFRILMVIIY